MRRVIFLGTASLMLISGLLIAHPHFTKTVTAELEGAALELRYTTYPYNEDRLSAVREGFVFHCGRATLTVEGKVSAGGRAIPAGEYAVRAQAKSLDDWTLMLIPAADAQGSDLSNAIRLESTTSKGLPAAHHLDLDLYSGHGSTEGEMILSVSFGQRKVEGVLDL